MRTKYSLLLFLLLSAQIYAQRLVPKSPSEVVAKIKENCNCSWSEHTVDTFKTGNPDSELTGIAVCMFADMHTLRQAVEAGCNFIITHEPVFYNHTDEVESYRNNQVFIDKMKFIEENDLIIFRFHDHIHKMNPDGIYSGMAEKLGIKQYAMNNEL